MRRAEQLAPSGAISKEDLDVRQQTVKVDEAAVDEALQLVYVNRTSLELPTVCWRSYSADYTWAEAESRTENCGCATDSK